MYSNVCNLFVCFNDDDYDNDCILYLAIPGEQYGASYTFQLHCNPFSYVVQRERKGVSKCAANIATAYHLPHDTLWARVV